MDKYLEDLLENCGLTGVAASPATPNLFVVNPDGNPLSAEKAEEFHSGVAKVLYLAHRVRPALKTSVAFLSTRVHAPQEEDWGKLERLYKYIRATRGYGLRLTASNPLEVHAFVDASYGVHVDCKSHTGVMITLGQGAVYSRSVKQKINTRSSTEAELVALSDSISQVIWVRNYLMSQGYDLGPAVVHQDNLSTLALVRSGKPTSDRTRHINIRYFFVRDKELNGEVKLVYTPTDEMSSDGLTKPLQGEAHRKYVAALGEFDSYDP
jgi:hypothetical protein